MGWSGGTEVFDGVVGVLLNEPIPDESKLGIMNALVRALNDQDWDTHNESLYWETDLVEELFRELYPELFEDPAGE